MFDNWINPIIIQIGPLAIHWYGLMYALTFLFAYWMMQHSFLGKKLHLNPTQKDNLLVALILGIIIGGRLGYILFYNLPFYLSNPLKIIALWEGGMSFHGGLLGTVLAIWIMARHYKIPFFKIGDLAAYITPIGILLGRIGNFINSELYGRITNNFCLHFPTDPNNCRYPSQLFEAATEGLLIFLILNWYLRKYSHAKPGQLSALFLILYGLARISMEFFREPDPQIGFLWGGITLGQLLSIFLLLAGIILAITLHSKKPHSSEPSAHHHA